MGVGHGIQSWMRQNGVAAQSPMTLLSEYLTPAPEQADLDHFERFVRFAAEQVRPLLE